MPSQAALRFREASAAADQARARQAVPHQPANALLDEPVTLPEVIRREQHARNPIDRLERHRVLSEAAGRGAR